MTITEPEPRWRSIRGAARHYGVDPRTITYAIEKHNILVLEFTPRCYRVDLNALDKVLLADRSEAV